MKTRVGTISHVGGYETRYRERTFDLEASVSPITGRHRDEYNRRSASVCLRMRGQGHERICGSGRGPHARLALSEALHDLADAVKYPR